MHLGVPALAYLLDHVVAGRSIMPGAGMFETGMAAAQSLLPDDQLTAGGTGAFGLTSATIPQAVLLKAASGKAGMLRCTVTAVTGDVELGGQSGEVLA